VLAGDVNTRNWDALLEQMQAILATEGEVALFIDQQFQQHADNARGAGQDVQNTTTIREALAAFRTALIMERRKLIQQELELYAVV
jgi:hypothetical protein